MGYSKCVIPPQPIRLDREHGVAPTTIRPEAEITLSTAGGQQASGEQYPLTGHRTGPVYDRNWRKSAFSSGLHITAVHTKLVYSTSIKRQTIFISIGHSKIRSGRGGKNVSRQARPAVASRKAFLRHPDEWRLIDAAEKAGLVPHERRFPVRLVLQYHNFEPPYSIQNVVEPVEQAGFMNHAGLAEIDLPPGRVFEVGMILGRAEQASIDDRGRITLERTIMSSRALCCGFSLRYELPA